MKAMVIDDSRTIRAILARMLRELGCQVQEAAHGREALALLRHGPLPDFALVDWNMPEMNGYEFVCAVRSDPVNAGVRLMMVTTESDVSRMQMALEAGADEYVMKPFTKEVIREKLRLIGIEGLP